MKRPTKAAFAIPLATLGILYFWARFRPEIGRVEAPDPVIVAGPAKHFVTETMARTSREMIERAAPSFEASGSDGRSYTLGELRRWGPVILTFVKDGCPCSEAAQPFFNRLHDAYPGAGFLGVIDSGAEKASRWSDRFDVAYPLLLDPGCRIVRAYNAENSAYVVLIDAEGRILKHWPGYSAGMLRELGATLAELTGKEEQPLDVSDAPDELYSGCPFDL